MSEIETGSAIDPLVCPRGHHSIGLAATRFHCQTCHKNGYEPNYDKSEMVDLRVEDPPLVEEGER